METTASSPTPIEWASERRRWSEFYAGRLAAQLEQAAVLASRTPPEELAAHFDSFLALLNATTGRTDLSPLWLNLVDRLIVMDNGRIVADGPRDEILAQRTLP